MVESAKEDEKSETEEDHMETVSWKAYSIANSTLLIVLKVNVY